VIPQGDKIMRAMAQTPQMEAGRVYIPARTPWRADFENELMKFPNGKHDDQVDSVGQALQWMAASEASWGIA
jgi:predicted phage terminase large subunit-like protein